MILINLRHNFRSLSWNYKLFVAQDKFRCQDIASDQGPRNICILQILLIIKCGSRRWSSFFRPHLGPHWLDILHLDAEVSFHVTSSLWAILISGELDAQAYPCIVPNREWSGRWVSSLSGAKDGIFPRRLILLNGIWSRESWSIFVASVVEPIL